MTEPEHSSPAFPVVPRHVAIIMDGNGRWAKKRMLPRAAGHQKGAGAVREAIRGCMRHGVEALTLFAFSSENWRRPSQEVSALLKLFVNTLEKEVPELDDNGIRLRFIGDRSAFSGKLRAGMEAAERQTATNDRLELCIAVNYGGKWDITQAARRLAEAVEAGEIPASEVDEAALARRLSTGGVPDPDLFIRTGGEQRISNFLLWQLAYAELYFTDELWPDFTEKSVESALAWFAGRERRFGQTSEQLQGDSDA